MSAEQRLAQAAVALDLSLTPQMQQQLLAYVALMDKWNRVYNLSAIRDPDDMLVKHVFDSLAVAPILLTQGLTDLLDVGTGAGLPGIPLAIVMPDLPITLLDSNHKKTRFLVQAMGHLGLKNVTVSNQRIENHQQHYSAIISRAFTALGNFTELTHSLLAPKGHLWAMKSQALQDELQEVPAGYAHRAWSLLVPELDAARYLVRLTKQEAH
ncbi:16S rRNA (guanine(527)-N(7))-methyltransferase RsmG [Thiomicrospira cyclica]|uniref:Ribosomal RNA small subunit methyltransferase G n=1 Tax=Thiomicrospira cyclica (strain DSM 14477 / JCM 11371 / ALM1) TaxID=717773 RepID=F6DBH3_THICA|nr:16S rRNA (guanine(527)-N(7))-methyltransferase RsmG [Thiomicrospira cyclica]AEG32375.1 Ribosomal RNA small subunit methyltransferase G [Thiomicrospira cyclica ALM1]